MSAERHRRLMELFDELCDLGPAEKRTRLADIKADDAALAADLGAMLAADEDGVSRLDRTPEPLADTFIPLVPTPPPAVLHRDGEGGLPAQIGDYKIIRQLGRGGMGVVYEAEQELPHRRVAIKLIREDVATQGMRNRFVAETHILARLNHPGIAQIYDAASSGPLLYLVMELVEGEALTHYADRQKLDVRARVELLAAVCDALAHAHQKGVIHRDLKPANILVAADGQPKVLDFGIARVVAEDSRDGRETLAGQLLGTPAYMSPEQTSFEAGELDLRSDVYTLGVIGFELLTGRLPHDVAGKQLLEVLRIIREVPPLPLSRADAELGGDLETVFGKALALEPNERYQSASALADDLRRYLADEPIAARSPSIVYQLGKWARRRRGLAASLGGLVTSLVGGGIIVVILYFQVDAARRTAVDARAVAEASRRDADEARALAERESRALAERTDALVLLDARAHLGDDPTVTVARLKSLGGHGWHEAALLVTEAKNRGVASDILVGHHGEIEDAAFSPSGTILVTGSKDRTVRRWDLAKRQVTVLRGHDAEIQAVAFAADGDRFATGDAEGNVLVWNARGERVGKGRAKAAVSCLVWAPDGSWVASAGGKGHVTRWGRDGQELATVDLLEGSIEHLAVSADGRRLAAAGEEEPLVGLLDVASGRSEHLAGHDQPVARVRFLADGTLLSAGVDGSVRRWQGSRSRVVGKSDGEVKELRVSADGETVVWADRLGVVTLLVRGRELRLPPIGGVIRDVVLSPAGDQVAVGGDDHALRIYSIDGELRRTFVGHRGRIVRILFSPDGQEVVSVSDDHTVRLWPASIARERGMLLQPPEVRTLAFAPDRPLLVAGAVDHSVWFEDLGGGPARRVTGASDLLYDTAFSPFGDLVAISSRDKSVRIYDPSGTLVHTLITPGRATRVAFSSTSMVAAAAHDSAVPVLHTRRRETFSLEGHTARVNDVAFSPRGDLLVTGSDDGSLRVVEFGDLRTRGSSEVGRPGSRVVRVTFVGRRAVGATASGLLYAMDLGSGAKAQIQAHDGMIRAIVPSPNEGLVTVGDDGWVRSFRPLFVAAGAVQANAGPLTDVQVAADGSIYTGGEDGRVLRWAPDLAGAPIVYLDAAGPVRALRLSPDGAWLAVAAEREALRLLPTQIDVRPESVRQILATVTRAAFEQGDVLASPFRTVSQ
jgi:eukaryotic-like serine/threonine-protein kinase